MLPTAAHAEWDVEAYVALQGEAEAAFDSQRYEEAIVAYDQLIEMLTVALRNKEIPAEQQPLAKEAIPIIRYQIGRSQIALEQCEAALSTFDDVTSDAHVPAEVVDKVPTRRAEAHLCLADQALAEDGGPNTSEALDRLEAADAALAEPTDDVSDDDRAELDADREAATARREEIESRWVDAVISGSTSLNCASAERELDAAAERVPSRASEIEAARDEATEGCLPLGPIILISAGGGLLLIDVILESVLLGTKSDFDDARAECDRTGTRCDEAIDLGEEIDNGRAGSIVLFIAGAAAITTGLVWWLVWEEPASAGAETGAEAAIFVSPTHDGGVIGLHGTF